MDSPKTSPIIVMLGDFDGALKLHSCHLKISKQLNDLSGISKAYANIGNAYSSHKQHQEHTSLHQVELHMYEEPMDRNSEVIYLFEPRFYVWNGEKPELNMLECWIGHLI